jgi:hypothetical protein
MRMSGFVEMEVTAMMIFLLFWLLTFHEILFDEFV